MRSYYFGWSIVAAAIAINALIIGITFAAFGLFVLPVSSDLNLSRAEMNTALILLNLGLAILAPVIGRLLDRVPVKRLMAVCSLLMGGGLVILSQSRSLWLDSVLIALPISAGVLGAGTVSVSVLIARWFSAYLGRAMALSAIGMSLGGPLVAPVVGWLIEAQGWRIALLLTGGAVGLLLFLLSFALRDRPGADDVEVPGEIRPGVSPAAIETPGTVKDTSTLAILRMPLFWTLGIGVALGLGVNGAFMVSVVPFSMEAGLTTMQGASLVSVIGVAGAVSILLLAVVADKFDRTVLLSSLMLFGILSGAVLLFADTYALLLVASVFVGFSQALLPPVYFALLVDRFGLATFGTVQGLMVPIIALLGAALIRFIGEIYDRTGGYDVGWWAMIAVDVVAALLILSTQPGRIARLAGKNR